MSYRAKDIKEYARNKLIVYTLAQQSKVSDVNDLIEIFKRSKDLRNSYHDVKPCLEAGLLKYLGVIASGVDDGLADEVDGERKATETECAERSSSFYRARELIAENLKVFEENFDVLEEELRKIFNPNNLVTSIKISEEVVALMNKVAKQGNLKRGLKSRALKALFDGLSSEDFENAIVEIAMKDLDELRKAPKK
ncbi:hypothetical protein IPA_06820 [Ignicoccus pacificus DSM 13166]|uniref:Uncharacterized protein n=1 Tax=Ignicoccus pacificus DSM 13166 TaxID=940294 RepID=A0A977KBH2_9CREN|nr:hypothetical protein IPA_06820 [Ignicoccus pacificus DSM 13166]